ncbi:MAG: hypothetical protein Q4G68_03755 [Planctomycetia bacterium]|nr:hypothetical protein [Planctomycetia bacterium]
MKATCKSIFAVFQIVTFLLAASYSTGQENGAQLHYHPEGRRMHDTWFLQEGNTTHVYHLQMNLPNSSRPDPDNPIGHAVSMDLLHWTEMPPALYPGKPGEKAYDDGPLFTGSAVLHEGVFYNFYCANHFESLGPNKPKDRQSMCLAVSHDGTNFTKYENNPIIEPTRGKYFNWYEEIAPFTHHAREWVDCRDMIVIKDPNSKGWLGYCVMRRKDAKNAFESSCIVLCRSDDLYHWEVGDPVCSPNRFNCFEVPDVFELDGRWFMLALTGDSFGQNDRWSDPDITEGTLVFEAESPLGPFTEVRNNLMLAAKYNKKEGYSARTVQRNGERLMLFTRKCPDHVGVRLSWPIKLVANPGKGNGLAPCYWRGCDNAFLAEPHCIPNIEHNQSNETSPIIHEVTRHGNRTFLNQMDISGTCEATVLLGSSDDSLDAMTTVKIKRVDEKYRSDDPAWGNPQRTIPCMVAVISHEGKELTSRAFNARESGINLRIVADEKFVYVFVDDILLMDFYAETLKNGTVTLRAERGTTIQNITYRATK